MKKLFSIVIVILVILSCSKNEQRILRGEWEAQTENFSVNFKFWGDSTYHFRSKKITKIEQSKGRYYLQDSTLTLIQKYSARGDRWKTRERTSEFKIKFISNDEFEFNTTTVSKKSVSESDIMVFKRLQNESEPLSKNSDQNLVTDVHLGIYSNEDVSYKFFRENQDIYVQTKLLRNIKYRLDLIHDNSKEIFYKLEYKDPHGLNTMLFKFTPVDDDNYFVEVVWDGSDVGTKLFKKSSPLYDEVYSIILPAHYSNIFLGMSLENFRNETKGIKYKDLGLINWASRQKTYCITEKFTNTKYFSSIHFYFSPDTKILSVIKLKSHGVHYKSISSLIQDYGINFTNSHKGLDTYIDNVKKYQIDIQNFGLTEPYTETIIYLINSKKRRTLGIY